VREKDSPWVDGQTIAQVLDQTATQFPRHDALIFPRLSYRRQYAGFAEDVRQAAGALLALGVGHGEHVGMWATNWPQWVVIQFAAASVGAVLVNINPAYRAHELRYVLGQADITTLFLGDCFKTTDYFALLTEVCPELAHCPAGNLRSPACPKLCRVINIQSQSRPGVFGWDEFLARSARVEEGALEARRTRVRPEEVVNVQYTSGTTGFPKGAMLTHRNLLMNAFHVGRRQGFTETDRLCAPVPFYHCFGCIMATLACVVHGSALVVPSESFDTLATLEAVQAERCTALYGVPTMFIAELEHPRFADFDLSSLRTGVMAGSPCPIEVMRAVVDRIGAREITICYGLTEASPVITQTEPGDSLAHRVGTVGRPLPGVEVRVIDPRTLEDLASGQPGELVARGPGIMRGYYNKAAETAVAFTPDGWLRTGDLAARTPDGYFRITGRIKDVIIRGGENVYPREVEEFLYSHPLVADVQVVGLPDERFGEEISAWVRLRPGAMLSEDELRTFCRDHIAHYKVPRYVVFVDDYPTTVTGKVQKFRLREMGIERFGLRKAAGVETA
jgi:fatty-acyl-CoA synthase